MNFKNFVEREDREKMAMASKIAEDMIGQLRNYYTNLFGVYFPMPKQVNTHEKFMDWRTSCRKYETQLPEYNGRKFSIEYGSAHLKGEYLDDKIKLYDKEFNRLNSNLRNDKHYTYEYNLRGTITPRLSRKNAEIKKEAKLMHAEMMAVFEKNKESYVSTLFHEIIHLLDHDKMAGGFKKATDNATGKLNREIKTTGRKSGAVELDKNFSDIYNKIYINSDIETNAWFLTGAVKSLKGQFPTFQDLLADFKQHFGNLWSRLLPDKQKKMVGRLYQLYK